MLDSLSKYHRFIYLGTQSPRRKRIQFVQVNYKRRLFRHRRAFEDPLWSTLSSVGMHSQFAGMNQCSHTSVTRLLVWSVWCTACMLYSQMDSEAHFSRVKFDFTFWKDEAFFSQRRAAMRFWASNIGQAGTKLSIAYLSLMEMFFPVSTWQCPCA